MSLEVFFPKGSCAPSFIVVYVYIYAFTGRTEHRTVPILSPRLALPRPSVTQAGHRLTEQA